MVVCDGLKGLSEAVNTVWDRAIIQTCRAVTKPVGCDRTPLTRHSAADVRLRRARRSDPPESGRWHPIAEGFRVNDPRPLTHDELWQLADHFDAARDRLLVLVAGYCGLRWGEPAALRWSDVDLEKGTLRVLRAYSEEAPRGELSPVKDHQARTVPIPRIVSEELVKYGADHNADDLVFPSANRTPLRNRHFRRDVFDDAVEDLGLDITPHNLRDTAASLAIHAGASVVAVARLLGHESAATTLNH
jgi:integrase